MKTLTQIVVTIILSVTLFYLGYTKGNIESTPIYFNKAENIQISGIHVEKGEVDSVYNHPNEDALDLVKKGKQFFMCDINNNCDYQDTYDGIIESRKKEKRYKNSAIYMLTATKQEVK